MSNDLISREALKEAFKAWKTMDDYYHNTDCNNIPFSEAFDLIDNAPTVEPTFGMFRAMLCETCQAYATNRAIVKLADDFTRPQGEWIDHSEDGYLECPFCNHLTNCEGNIDELHYCWNCGAKMKGGAE